MIITREFSEILQNRLSEHNLLIQAIVGPRQVGKTTGVKAVIDRFPEKKIFESADSFEVLTPEWLQAKWQLAMAMGEGTLLVIDEIQKIPQWSDAVKKLFDQHRDKKLKIVILGSASFRIQKGLHESLAGRYELINVPHWNYHEMKMGFGLSSEDYLKYGGYPGAAEFIKDEQRWKQYIRDSIIENVLSKDIIDIAEVRNPSLLKQLFFLAMSFPAQEVAFQKLLGQLVDKGAIATIKHYLELLESAHLIKLLYKFGSKTLVSRTSSPKILPLTPGLIGACEGTEKVTSNLVWRGRVFEAAVGAALAHIADEIYYWREGKYEVDFIIKIDDKLIAVEVKSGRPRGLNGLEKFSEAYPHAIPLTIDWDKGMRLLSIPSFAEFKKDFTNLLQI